MTPEEIRRICEQEVIASQEWVEAKGATPSISEAYGAGVRAGFLKLAAILRDAGILPKE